MEIDKAKCKSSINRIKCAPNASHSEGINKFPISVRAFLIPGSREVKAIIQLPTVREDFLRRGVN